MIVGINNTKNVEYYKFSQVSAIWASILERDLMFNIFQVTKY